jgi:VIT1/CCC1 family predicted Fe2+/Mn2+ transporter
MHNKSSLKYGAYGQKMAILDSTLAQIYRLKAELCQINEKLKTDLSEDGKQALNDKKEEIIEQLKIIRNNTEEVQPRSEARDEDWATTSDVLRTSMLTLGTFLCSFSGILAIMGTLVPYLPVIAATSVISAGIPIAGWIALGVCLVVGIGVAIWAYQTKYKNVLQNSGKARKELHEKRVTICDELNKFSMFAPKDSKRPSANHDLQQASSYECAFS